MTSSEDRLRELVAEVTAAYLSQTTVAASEIPRVIEHISNSLAMVGSSKVDIQNAEAMPQSPRAVRVSAAQVRRSITPEAIISFEDGKSYKTLKRHLSTRGLTVEAYKEKWGLPQEYPVVAPNYSAARSAMAVSLGLGQKGGRKKRNRA